METLTTHYDDTPVRYREAIFQRAIARKHELSEVILGSILTELPEYASGRSPAELEDIRAGVHGSIELCLSAIGSPRALGEAERAALRSTGAQRARQGIPKPVVLAGVRVAIRVGRTFLMTCTEVGDDPEALMAAFRDVSNILDRFEDEACACLGDGHDEAWAHVLSTGDRGEAVLVDRLLEQRFVDEDEVLEHAAEMGLSRSRDARVVVLTAAGGEDAVARLKATAAAVRELGMAAVGPLKSTGRMHVPCVVQPRHAADWARIVNRLEHVGRRHCTSVVWSDAAARLTVLAPVYRDLRDDLPFATVARSGAGTVPSLIVRFHRITCSGTPVQRMQLMAEILAPLDALPQRERNELLETLDALYETGGSVAALARQLHVHKNTVGNRLRRVREVLRLDVRNPAERLVLETAVRARHAVGVYVNR